MPDDARPDAAVARRCPWCSAELPANEVATCPTCGASLQSDGEPQVPGVTAIDPVAVLEGSREPRRPRNRILAWLSGDTEEAAQPGDRGALAPPEPAVRREMLRLEMEAELASLSAEAESIATDEALEAADEGDQPRADADIKAAMDADAATDALVESPEELQAASDGPAEVGQADPHAPAAGGTPAGA
ncbi:MAG TPA: hypothetical protein VEY67_00525 [Candidatus Dormibacteraeota bacterium]|nr:hypothetical protein [Candidatus Dormibacteraeota bacterium]